MIHFIERGNLAGPTLVFIHGWPDTDRVFDKQYAAMQSTYRLVCMQLPNFAAPCTTFPRPSGYTIEEVADMLNATVKAAVKGRRGSSSGGDDAEKPALIVHDWGSILGYLMVRQAPQQYRKLITMDVGQHVGRLSLLGLALVLGYQWSLIVCFYLPFAIGSLVTKSVALVARAPNMRHAHSGMNYLYIQLWKLIWTGEFAQKAAFNPPTIPTLYMYGAKKPFHFHSQQFVAHVRSMPGSAVMPFDEDHWFFMRPSCADAANKAMLTFLATP